MIKQEAIDCILTLPDTADWNDILYSLYVIQKIEKGRQEAKEEKGIPTEEARRMLKQYEQSIVDAVSIV